MSYIGNMILCAVALAALLPIGGEEQNPGPGVEAETTVQVLCSGCKRILKYGSMRQLWMLVSQQQWLKWLTAGNGAAIGVNGTGFISWRKNWKMLCNKSRIRNGRPGDWKSSKEL
jgi:hypothetical protein